MYRELLEGGVPPVTPMTPVVGVGCVGRTRRLVQGLGLQVLVEELFLWATHTVMYQTVDASNVL